MFPYLHTAYVKFISLLFSLALHPSFSYLSWSLANYLAILWFCINFCDYAAFSGIVIDNLRITNREEVLRWKQTLFAIIWRFSDRAP
jgi:hypothetical protein